MNKSEIRIGVLGCAGRTGSLIVSEIQKTPNVVLSGGTIRSGTPKDYDFYVTEDPGALFERSDVIVDFTIPEATAKHIWLAAKHHKAYVVGTTGLNNAQEQEINDAAKEAPILYAANMSVGVNMLQALVEQAAARLGAAEWDIEINETHHKHKIDAPSGTALALGKAAQKGRKALAPTGRGLGEGEDVFDRSGERKLGDIGFSVQRGGDVAGEHIVSFFAEGERLELTHKATDRAIFAKGALRAALWLKDQPHGLYSMRDVLGL